MSFNSIKRLFCKHQFGIWQGRVFNSGFSPSSFWGVRVKVCTKCGKQKEDMTNNEAEFHEWVREAKKEEKE